MLYALSAFETHALTITDLLQRGDLLIVSVVLAGDAIGRAMAGRQSGRAREYLLAASGAAMVALASAIHTATVLRPTGRAIVVRNWSLGVFACTVVLGVGCHLLVPEE
jgi:hypothetical protein